MTIDGQRRQYGKPPIEEALCEVYFEGGVDWDVTAPGLLFEEFRTSYPAKPRSQIVGSLQLDTQPQGAAIQLQQSTGRVQFLDESEHNIVSVGPGVLSVHRLRPYISWEELRQRIEEALEAFQRVINATGVKRVGIRYINKIQIESTFIDDLRTYFTRPPDSPPDIPLTMSSFVVRCENNYDDTPARLITTFASVPDAEQSDFVLDIDVYQEWSDPLGIDSLLQVVDDLRARERVAFESLITDELRKLFR